ncbi:DUF397 domain-containing protein [Kitasatospora sp. MAP5-34]|uniref:DUF397 domain-containing protein n=1 Tax=Kitasatospora sp. MAP5-34 TaxID=3035102 RepID=UPI002476A794|nr:DUF397 domain-containing protein [Kitasatospora sp. MAP5-34]MDH6577649.1 hypothetical protein [Kitasatospora sp. MAP5-34]
MLTWQKSSFSGSNDGNSVELAQGDADMIHIRESLDPDKIVTTDRARLRAFVLGVKAGEFDHLL